MATAPARRKRARRLDPVILKIAEKIAREYQPEKIILFGSHAWGTPGPDSDVDLLVVKESTQDRFERTRSLDTLLYPRRVGIDILVYTPAELDDSIQRRKNLFIQHIVENGRVLYDAHAVRR
ncbi:MAG: nucleotidyltransferase domain-containing protein [Candidatus Uhrbacteria bacterium]